MTATIAAQATSGAGVPARPFVSALEQATVPPVPATKETLPAAQVAGYSATLRLFGTADDSIVDGPGIRFAVFTQGCKHNCPGCHNLEAQPFEGGRVVALEELKQQIENNPLLAGITLSGGEPFEQPEPLAELARWAKGRGLNVWAYSGYVFEELALGASSALSVAARELLEAIDVLVDGRFIAAEASHSLKWRGSTNQRIIDVPASLKAGAVWEMALER